MQQKIHEHLRMITNLSMHSGKTRQIVQTTLGILIKLFLGYITHFGHPAPPYWRVA